MRHFRQYLALSFISLQLLSFHSMADVPSPIDLNTATKQILMHAIKGIGEKRAEAILKYREEHGAFSSIQDLAKVKGIGPLFVERNRTELEKIFQTQ